VNKMKDLFIVTKFTMKDMLQRKSFIITTIIFLIMIVVGFNIPNFMKMLNKDSDVNKIEIIDSFCFLCNAFYLYLYRAKRSKP